MKSGHAAYTVDEVGRTLIWIFPYSDLERLTALQPTEGGEYPSGRGGSLPGTRKGCSVMENVTTEAAMKQRIMRKWSGNRQGRQC